MTLNCIFHEKVWKKKATLRLIYEDYYRKILGRCIGGLTLEVGGGHGNFKEFFPEVVSTDIISRSSIDTVCDAQALPFSDGSFANVISVDTLHHIERPVMFIKESLRVLRPGGKFVLLEPAITPLSKLGYRLHPEPVDMTANPLIDEPSSGNWGPFDANQGIATLLCGRFRKDLEKVVPNLEFVETEYESLFVWPLSGGYQTWSLIPSGLVKPLLAIEKKLICFLGRYMAFRIFVVFSKS